MTRPASVPLRAALATGVAWVWLAAFFNPHFAIWAPVAALLTVTSSICVLRGNR